jgi:hypothetical protein
MPPELWRNDDGGGYLPSVTQKEILWPQWVESWDAFKRIGKRADRSIVHNGDTVAGTNPRAREVVSRRITEHEGIHIACMDWAIQHVKAQKVPLYYTRGTKWHQGEDYASTERCARDLEAVPAIEGSPEHNYRDGRYSWYVLRLNANGQELRFAHHGPKPGTRPWTLENSLYYELKRVYWEYLERGEKPPRACVWSHYHTFLHTTFQRNGVKIDGFITPGFSALGSFGTRAGKGLWRPDIGMLILIVDDNGELSWECPRVSYEPAPLLEV